MRAHLKAKHGIDLSTIKISAEKTKKLPKIYHFFKAEKDSLSVILSELVACDGLPVRALSKSQRIRDALGAQGYKVSADVNAIRAIIMKQGVEIKTLFKKQYQDIRNLNHRFSLTLDEYTSMQNRRYMNINVYVEGWNLGLVRIFGSMPAEKAVAVVKKKLDEF